MLTRHSSGSTTVNLRNQWHQPTEPPVGCDSGSRLGRTCRRCSLSLSNRTSTRNSRHSLWNANEVRVRHSREAWDRVRDPQWLDGIGWVILSPSSLNDRLRKGAQIESRMRRLDVRNDREEGQVRLESPVRFAILRIEDLPKSLRPP